MADLVEPQAQAVVPALKRDLDSVVRDTKSTVRDILEHPQMMARMRASVPRHMSPERMLRVLVLAVQKNPKLAECTKMSLLGCMMTCATLGWEPNSIQGHAYLIPFKRKVKQGDRWTEVMECTLIGGYRGLLDLARRTGQLKTVHCDVVYTGDQFSYQYGTDSHMRHVPGPHRSGEWTHAYAYVRLEGGVEQFEVMTREDVLKIRNRAQGYSQPMRFVKDGEVPDIPWITWEDEMAKKMPLRRLSKWLPISVEFAHAAALDEMADAGRMDFSKLAGATDVLSHVEQGFLEHTSEEPMNTGDTGAGQKEPEKVAVRTETKKPDPEAGKPPAGQGEPAGGGGAATQALPPAGQAEAEKPRRGRPPNPDKAKPAEQTRPAAQQPRQPDPEPEPERDEPDQRDMLGGVGGGDDEGEEEGMNWWDKR